MKDRYENTGMRVRRQSNYDEMLRHPSGQAEITFRRPPYFSGRKGDRQHGTQPDNR